MEQRSWAGSGPRCVLQAGAVYLVVAIWGSAIGDGEVIASLIPGLVVRQALRYFFDHRDEILATASIRSSLPMVPVHGR